VNSFKTILFKKARKSLCCFRIAALAIGHKGELLGTSFNKPRFQRKGGGIHAEMVLMARYGKNIKTIAIMRIGGMGDVLPIHACSMCRKKADELGIRIVNISDI
jgi:hypothetical protein